MLRARRREKKPTTPSTREDAIVPTDDDWYPSLTAQGECREDDTEPGYVRLSFMPLIDVKRPNWRVCCWGGDDSGMEQDFYERDQAEAVFLLLKNGGPINRKDLTDLGFVPA